jgi:hypothetical protein
MNRRESDKSGRILAGASWIVLALNVSGILLLPVVFVAIKPRFLKLFEQCSIALPRMTRVVISVPVWVYFLVCLGVSAALLIKELLITGKKAKLIVNVVAAIVASAFVLLFALAFILPLMSLISELETAQ